MIEKAVKSNADRVLIDLEDAVAPNEKEAARQTVVSAMRDLDWGIKLPAFRMNALDTPYFVRDLTEVLAGARARVRWIVVPKLRRPEDIYAVDTVLSALETEAGLEPGAILLEAQIETAEGLTNVERIALASPRLRTLNFGPGDLAASMRMPSRSIGAFDEWDAAYPGHRMHYPMMRIAAAARAAGLNLIDGPLADFRDDAALRRSCAIARGLGYDGKWVIHPAQIDIVNEAFSPTEEEIAWARRVIDAYAQSTAAGTGAISLDGKLIDAASIRMAQGTIALSESSVGGS